MCIRDRHRWDKRWTENARWSKVTPAHCVDCSESFINPQSFIFSCKTVHKNFTTLKNNKIYQPKEGRMSNTSLSMELGFSPSQTFLVIPKDIKPTLPSTNRTIPLEFFFFIRLYAHMEALIWNILKMVLNITWLSQIFMMELRTDRIQLFTSGVWVRNNLSSFKALKHLEQTCLLYTSDAADE